MKLAFHYYVGFLEPLFHVSHVKLEVVGDVAAFARLSHTVASGPQGWVSKGQQPLVKDGGVVFHCVVGVEHRLQHLILHVYQGQRLLGDVDAGGGNRRQGMAPVQDLLSRQDVTAVEPVIDGCPLFQVGHLGGDLGQISGGHYRLDPILSS